MDGADAVVREVFEVVFNQRQLDRIPEFVADDFVDADPIAPQCATGPAGLRATVELLTATYDRMHTTVVETIAQGERVFAHWTLDFFDSRGYRGAPPSHQQQSVRVFAVFTVAGGRLHRRESIVDVAGLMARLGGGPGPETAPGAR